MRLSNSVYKLINGAIFIACAAGILLTVMWPNSDGTEGLNKSIFNGHKITFASDHEPHQLDRFSQHLYFLHLHSNAAPGGNGSFEKPFADFKNALIAAHEARSAIIYIWGGTYRVDAQSLDGLGTLSPGLDLIIAGAAHDLEMGGVTVPAQIRNRAVIQVVGLSGQNAETMTEPAGSFIFLEPTAQITLSGVTLEGNSGLGAAVYASAVPRQSTATNNIRLDNCVIRNFAAAIFCDPNNRSAISVRQGNVISDNSLYGILSGWGKVHLGRNNKITGNGRDSAGAGLYSHYGNIELGSGNDISQNGYGVFVVQGNVVMMSENIITGNSSDGIVSDNGHVQLKNQNIVAKNGGNGVEAANTIGIGDNNDITDNAGNGLMTRQGIISMRNSNNVSGNGYAGAYSGKDLVISGNFNMVRRNGQKGDKDWHDVMTLNGSILMDGTNNDIPTIVGTSVFDPNASQNTKSTRDKAGSR